MTCTSPLRAFRLRDGGVSFIERGDVVSDLALPCGQCTSCRLKRSREWAIRISHEAQLHKDNCFITLTYDDEHLPPDGSLRYADFQQFMRRLRKLHPGRTIRFFMCGEYGSTTRRAHFHACLFGVRFADAQYWKRSTATGAPWIYSSRTLSELWPAGHASVGELNIQTAAYTARYVMKKVTGDAAESHYQVIDQDGVITQLVPEFCRMSLKPGIGAGWFRNYRDDVYTHDLLVDSRSRKGKPPRYYDKLRKREDPNYDENISFPRELRARERAEDTSPERLIAKDEVLRSKIRTLKRTL
ncbi:MAG: replication initiator protein [Microviridae sp.]|nr:MAG: replication initiator protein [Microviridae sp.]